METLYLSIRDRGERVGGLHAHAQLSMFCATVGCPMSISRTPPTPRSQQFSRLLQHKCLLLIYDSRPTVRLNIDLMLSHLQRH